MGKIRKQYSKEFKAKIALEAMKELRTINEIASQYQLHPNQVVKWKKQLLENVVEIFEDGRKTKNSNQESNNENELYQQIGKLQMELEWLKKKSSLMI